jgi:GT2 family glycosyltransferase
MTLAVARPNPHPTIGVLILNRNGMNWLPIIYDSIFRNVYPHVLIYLVDNASDDGSVELTLDRYPEVTVIRMPQNLGFCMAYNLAMPYTFVDGCEWVIWANNDVKVEPGCLNEMARVAQSDSKIGVLGPAFLAWESDEPNYYMVGNHPYAITAMKSQSREPIDVEWVEGSFLMVSRRCFEAVGPLDPHLFFYWEETDFCRRARHQGWRVVLVPSALTRHYGGWSTGDPKNMITANKLRARNYYIYKLADPFKAFSSNLIAAIHLLLVNMKQYFLQKPSLVLFHIRTFAWVLGDIHVIYQKWIRDRKGDYPPATTSVFQGVQPEIILAKLRVHRR